MKTFKKFEEFLNEKLNISEEDIIKKSLMEKEDTENIEDQEDNIEDTETEVE